MLLVHSERKYSMIRFARHFETLNIWNPHSTKLKVNLVTA